MTKKDQILQTATHLFAAKGFADASTAEISRVTGTAEGTIFYHFKTKEDLFVAVLENVKNTIIDEFKGYMDGREFGSGLEMTEGAINFYLYLAGHMEDAFLLLHRHFPYVLARTNPVCRKHLEDIYNFLQDIFEDAVARGVADGSILDLPPRRTALILFTLVDGMVRCKTYNLYDAGALYNPLMEACRRMLANPKGKVDTC